MGGARPWPALLGERNNGAGDPPRGGSAGPGAARAAPVHQHNPRRGTRQQGSAGLVARSLPRSERSTGFGGGQAGELLPRPYARGGRRRRGRGGRRRRGVDRTGRACVSARVLLVQVRDRVGGRSAGAGDRGGLERGHAGVRGRHRAHLPRRGRQVSWSRGGAGTPRARSRTQRAACPARGGLRPAGAKAGGRAPGRLHPAQRPLRLGRGHGGRCGEARLVGKRGARAGGHARGRLPRGRAGRRSRAHRHDNGAQGHQRIPLDHGGRNRTQGRSLGRGAAGNLPFVVERLPRGRA